MRSYTNINQSKKLVEFLPIESANMYYSHEFVNSAGDYYRLNIAPEGYFDDEESPGSDIPCWSLTALIDIIENIDKRQKVEVSFTHNGGKYWVDIHFDEFGSFCQDHELYDSKVDALVAMIEKIKNRGLL